MLTFRPLTSKDETGREMYRLIESYYGDLDKIFIRRNGKFVPFSSLPMLDAFNVVKRIKYRRDSQPVEVVSRPLNIAIHSPLGMDCKKKSIFLSSYLRGNGIPYRLIASSKRADGRFHHVFPQCFLGSWHNLDATYSHNKPFQKKTITRAEVLSD